MAAPALPFGGAVAAVVTCVPRAANGSPGPRRGLLQRLSAERCSRALGPRRCLAPVPTRHYTRRTQVACRLGGGPAPTLRLVRVIEPRGGSAYRGAAIYSCT